MAKLNRSEQFDNFVNSKELREIINSYKLFKRETITGEQGSTVQYWLRYVDMVNLYRQFSRSIQTGDLSLYIHCLPKIGDYFFAFNHPNYARWIVKFHKNLLELETSHPDLHEEFK